MNLKWTVARRYLLSPKSSSAINIITGVSTIGIAIGTAALILVLSVFNGLTDFIEGLFAAVDPDIKIVAAQGMTFEEDSTDMMHILTHPDVAGLSRSLEGRVVLQYIENQTIATLKGVGSNFTEINPLDEYIYGGNYTFAPKNGVSQAIFGSLVAARLRPNTDDEQRPVRILYIPQDASSINPMADQQSDVVFPAGYFSIQKEYDEQLVFTDLAYVQRLFRTDELTAYEIKLSSIDKAESVKKDLEQLLGEKYEVLTWYEQHATLYRVMRNEKYISYLILVLMLAIAAINIVGGLSMIVLEKTRDIAVLKSMGATDGLIRQVFQYLGLLVGGIGGGLGLILALLAGLGQKYLGLIKLQGGESFRVKAFPIEMHGDDFLLVFITVIFLASLASVYPARQAARVQVVKGTAGVASFSGTYQ